MINGKQKGNSFERQICHELRMQGYEAERSSYVNKKLDDVGKVDIESNYPANIQCKATERYPDFHKVLKEMDQSKLRVIFQKKNNKGCIAVMLLDDFYDLIHDESN